MLWKPNTMGNISLSHKPSPIRTLNRSKTVMKSGAETWQQHLRFYVTFRNLQSTNDLTTYLIMCLIICVNNRRCKGTSGCKPRDAYLLYMPITTTTFWLIKLHVVILRDKLHRIITLARNKQHHHSFSVPLNIAWDFYLS